MQSKKKTQQTGIIALYCRLSRDDGQDGDSNSVANQKRMLSKYAKENNLGNTRYYVDDGYTGTNFRRPSFQKLLEDIEMGYVSTVIVKDMSRLGRDYLQVGYYTDTYFPEHGIRFIAINDMVDSEEGENELAPIPKCDERNVRQGHQPEGSLCPSYPRQQRGAFVPAAIRLYEVTGKQKAVDHRPRGGGGGLCGPQALQFQPNLMSKVLLVKLLDTGFIFEGG